jgi:hypothetical protein
LVAKLKDYNLPDKVFCSKTEKEETEWDNETKRF